MDITRVAGTPSTHDLSATDLRTLAKLQAQSPSEPPGAATGFHGAIEALGDGIKDLRDAIMLPPRVPGSVYGGQLVGRIVHDDARGNTTVSDVRVEEVVGRHASRDQAEEAARRWSAEHGGANVAIVRSERSEVRLRDGRLHRGRPEPTYTVVTLDPPVSASHAGELRANSGLFGPGRARIVSVGNDAGLRRVPNRTFEHEQSFPDTFPPRMPISPLPYAAAKADAHAAADQWNTRSVPTRELRSD